MKPRPKRIPSVLMSVALLATTATAGAQLIYVEDFETDHSLDNTWVTNSAGNSPVDLYFDYSTVGIPLAPNSASGSTRGAKLNANLGDGITTSSGEFPSGSTVSPLGFHLSQDTNFIIHCDVWINFNGPAPGGGSGSTQVGGLGWGTEGTSPQIPGVADSLFVNVTGEGQSSADYRVYSAAIPASIGGPNGDFTAYLAGSRNQSASYYTINFPGQSAPPDQVTLYPQQTGTTVDGAQGWKWRDWSLEKIGPFVTWRIDNIPIAYVDLSTNGVGGGPTLAGDLLLLTHGDINATASIDPNAQALAFSLFDNLRVSNIVANVVTINATLPDAAESGQIPATFTIARGITGSPLTVQYSIGGLATNGVDYTNALGGALTGSVTLSAGDSATNITIVPIDDSVSEAKETILLTLLNGPGYVAVGNATATIEDNDMPLLIASTASTAAGGADSMFERHTNDYASIKITRWGDTSGFLSLDANNFSYGGGAVLDVDYVVNSNLFPISINGGESEVTVNLVSPLDDSVYTGNKTLTVGLVAGGGFSVSSSTAAVTIRDDENPPATVLYTNSLTSAADAVNWNVTHANGDQLTFGDDYEVSFGYDLSADASGGGIIAPPPGGANNALRTTVNKNLAQNGAVDLYPTNMSFSGDFAVRFNMNVIIDTAGGTTQGPIFGINHDGQQTNWWAGSGVVTGGPWASDGIWYWISPDGGAGAGDYLLFTGLGGALPNTGWMRPVTANLDEFVNAFKGPPAPYSGYAGPGLVGNDPNPADNYNWTDVEIKQVQNIVTMYLNKIPVLTYSNTTTFTSGYIMLGYSDPFNSLGQPAGAVYYANLSVVQITGPLITGIERSGNDVTINFTSSDGTDTPAGFKLEGASIVTGPYAEDTAATIVQLPDGTYRATTTSVADTHYYRIRK